MHHQYRYIRSCQTTEMIRKAIPRLVPFFYCEDVKYYPESPRFGNQYGYEQMFGHELAHCLDMVHRGQTERLKLDNFGWPRGEFGHTAKTATLECRVFALQYLIEEAILGRQYNDILCLHDVCIALGARHKNLWKSFEQHDIWMAEGKVEHRIHGFMEEHRPTFKALLNKTVDYIVDECAEFV